MRSRGRESAHSSRGENRLSTKRRPIYKGKVVDLGIELVQLPDGRELELEVVRHPGGAAVAAIDAEGRVCLVRQYRHAAGGWIWELPAGKLDPGEAPLTTAQRELAEEAGLRAEEWAELGSIFSTPGFTDEVLYLYLARELREVPTSHDEHELIEVHWRPFDEAAQEAADGRLRDAKTVVALLRAREVLGR